MGKIFAKAGTKPALTGAKILLYAKKISYFYTQTIHDSDAGEPPLFINDFMKMSTSGRHIRLGQAGERAAILWLQQKGHIILHTNYRAGHKEIDVISKHLGVLVFTEIKTRSHASFGFPEEAVTLKKQQLLKAAAEEYLLQFDTMVPIRFDILSILMSKGQVVEMLHFEDAFY